MLRNGRSEALPELFNQIFSIELDWDFLGVDKEVSLDALEEFSHLTNKIVNSSMDQEYHSAISFLWSVRNYVGIEKFNSRDFVGTEISSDTSVRIMELLQSSQGRARSAFAPYATSGPSLSSLAFQKDTNTIFEVFLEKERLLLRDWGLNQNSTEIIVNRLRSHRSRTLYNLTYPSASVNSNSIAKATNSLSNLTKLPVRIRTTQRTQRLKIPQTHRSKNVMAKDKLIGLATLFGDAAPLVAGLPLDVTSFISTSAGATAMAILTRSTPGA